MKRGAERRGGQGARMMGESREEEKGGRRSVLDKKEQGKVDGRVRRGRWKGEEEKGAVRMEEGREGYGRERV